MSAKRYDLAVFDLDGTLLDTSEGILAAVRYTIGAMGFAPLPEAQLLTFIGQIGRASCRERVFV